MTDGKRLKRSYRAQHNAGESLRMFARRMTLAGGELALAASRWLLAKGAKDVRS